MKTYISMLAFLMLITGVTAQESQEVNKRNERRKAKSERRDSRIEAKKIGYITEELDLTKEEAQKFWPIYNDFQKEMKALKENTRQSTKVDQEYTDAEARVFLNNVHESEQKRLDLKKSYYKEMEQALSVSKIAKLHHIEREFREKVYKSLKRKMKQKHKGRDKDRK